MNEYNNNEQNRGDYNHNIYMEPSSHNYSTISDSEGQSPRTPKKKGKVLKAVCALALAACFTAGVSVGSIALYTKYGQNGGSANSAGNTVGGQKVVYTLSSETGALTAQEIFVKASPWVVAISCSSESRFGTSQSTGTGIIMTEDGYIITNNHVIEGATSIVVTAGDGNDYQASVVGSEAQSDIAVLKIEATGLQAAEFGKSSDLVVGDTAIVIGNPLGLTFADTMTQGIISSIEREVQIDEYIMSLIQIDAAVNPGNSGGPLINSQGQVVGVVNAKVSDSDVEGIGFAIPIDTALDIANDLIEYGYVQGRPVLGITVMSITESQAYYYGYEPGITVTEVTPGSCAEQGGIKVGDKIVAFNGVEVSTSTELNFQKEKCSIGDTVTITVERDGQTLDLSVTLSQGTAA